MNKKILNAERNMQNKLKLVQTTKQTPSLTQSLRTTEFTKSQGVTQPDSQVKQLKARVANVEKSYEFSKQKIKQLEDELKAKNEELKKRDDDVQKLKAQKNKLLKEIQANKTDKPKLSIEDLIPTKENLSELDESMMSEAIPSYSKPMQRT